MRAKKYHISASGKNAGRLAPCSAKFKACPLGTEEDHKVFATAELANEYSDLTMAVQYGGSFGAGSDEAIALRIKELEEMSQELHKAHYEDQVVANMMSAVATQARSETLITQAPDYAGSIEIIKDVEVDKRVKTVVGLDYEDKPMVAFVGNNVGSLAEALSRTPNPNIVFMPDGNNDSLRLLARNGKHNPLAKNLVEQSLRRDREREYTKTGTTDLSPEELMAKWNVFGRKTTHVAAGVLSTKDPQRHLGYIQARANQKLVAAEAARGIFTRRPQVGSPTQFVKAKLTNLEVEALELAKLGY